VLGLLLAAAVIGGPPLAAEASQPARRGDPRGPRVATVVVDPSLVGAPVAADVTGLSVEARALASPAIGASGRTLPTLLRTLGPGVLRFGGNSVDRSFGYAPGGRVPSWASGGYTDGDLDRLHALLLATGWTAMLGVSLGHFDPAAAQAQTRAAVEHLGSTLSSVEVGNEPNLYYRGLRPPR